ncbi:MAG: hypothetical protein PHP61_03225 [Candidatus Izemoplasmatales bacterium]|jgi:hypothetical protein|nr:hypothetical protein [Candidatus Izemoplasmatales bacterium]MDY0372907.1 hypothetical protein [Candidatus Izemoplasmatales bacterium]NLF48017.1 hypothetical protein [Acholeplasmataceae bacterium]
MICLFCSAVFVVELTFETLFHPPKLCPTCQKLSKTKPHLEVIPTRLGEIHYSVLIPSDNADKEQLNRLQPFLTESLEIALSKQNEDSIILWIDRVEFGTFQQWFPALGGYQHYQFLSLFAFDFSYYLEWI